jgi:hypothetical protein
MLDDVDRTEVGKLRNDFLTDEQGRRIYCAPFGSARWVPSLEEEEKLGRLKFRVLFVGMVVAVLGATALSIWWDEGSSLTGMWVAPVCGAQMFAVARYVRRWPAIPRSEFNYASYVTSIHERRSLLSLWSIVLSRIAVCAGLVIAPIWLLAHHQPTWSDLTLSKKIAMVVLALMLPAILLGIALSTHRAWAVLRKRI